MQNKNHSHTGGHMTTPSPKSAIILQPCPMTNYVTWANGKRQIRAAIKAIGWTAVGLFRPRKENKNEFSIMARDKHGNLHHIKCERKPYAIIEQTLITA